MVLLIDNENPEMRNYSSLTDREKLECEAWEAYKLAYGMRPRHINFLNMSDEDIKKLIAQCASSTYGDCVFELDSYELGGE